MNNLKSSRIFKFIQEKMNWNFFIILGMAGVLLIAAGELFPKSEKVKSDNAVTSSADYCKSLEDSLTQLLSSVKGAGKVKVMITLEAGEEMVYVQQEKTTDDVQTVQSDNALQENTKSTYENQFVMVTDGSNKSALIEKTIQPTIQGVVVVCEGADDISVVSDITNAVAVALSVKSNRICVIQMQ